MYRFPGKWYWAALLLLVLATWAYMDQRGLNDRIEAAHFSQEQVEALRDELRAAEATMSRLEARVEHLHGDPVEMEAAVRRNKNLVREGETRFRVVLPEERGSE
jgi:cell division protein FtsB